jgi:hypothetical protein
MLTGRVVIIGQQGNDGVICLGVAVDIDKHGVTLNTCQSQSRNDVFGMFFPTCPKCIGNRQSINSAQYFHAMHAVARFPLNLEIKRLSSLYVLSY